MPVVRERSQHTQRVSTGNLANVCTVDEFLRRVVGVCLGPILAHNGAAECLSRPDIDFSRELASHVCTSIVLAVLFEGLADLCDRAFRGETGHVHVLGLDLPAASCRFSTEV